MFQDLDKESIYVVFFSSKDFVSRSIRNLEKIWFRKRKNIFSHVGLLFHESILDKQSKMKICKPPKESFLVLESTLSGPLNDNVKNTCNRVKFGVQVRRFSDLIKSYRESKGKIAVCKIKNLHSKGDIFNQTLKEYLDKRYEMILTNLLTVHFPIHSPVYKGSVFCSELVCLILQRLGLISKELIPKKISPNGVFNIALLSEPIYFVH